MFRSTATRLIIGTAVFLMMTGNITFFGQVLRIYPWVDGNAGFVISLGILLTCVLALLLAVLSMIIPARIVITVLLILTAAIGYFSDTFGTVIDAEMLRNAVETDTAEAGDLLSGGFLLRLLLLGIVPVALIWLVPLKQASRMREAGYRAQTVLVTLLIAIICLYSFSDTYAGFFRQQKQLRYYTNPTFALYSLGQIIVSSEKPGSAVITSVIEEASLPLGDSDHELIIMVVGETARRDRFSLNGYKRMTNPELAKEENLVSYTNIDACGTSTRISVPCMFSILNRNEFSNSDAAGMENVLDVLHRVGVSILWRDNNSSAKGVADRVVYEDFKTPAANPVCDPECRDVGMLHNLQTYIDAEDSDILIVLHQMGNHGPAYFKRYPPEFERFTPACHSEELSNCSPAEIDNAYDNAILYTDYFLSQVIALLKANTPRFETAMLYVSDHGESMGEKGLYLHGMPYAIAPKEQTEVPVIVWIGHSSDVDIATAVNLHNKTNSHDAVFSALLALFEIEHYKDENGAPLFELKVEE